MQNILIDDVELQKILHCASSNPKYFGQGSRADRPMKRKWFCISEGEWKRFRSKPSDAGTGKNFWIVTVRPFSYTKPWPSHAPVGRTITTVYQCLLGRGIVITEDPNEHLMWHETRIFLKPLPTFLLGLWWSIAPCTRASLLHRSLEAVSRYQGDGSWTARLNGVVFVGVWPARRSQRSGYHATPSYDYCGVCLKCTFDKLLDEGDLLPGSAASFTHVSRVACWN